ncbi:hypothetical protein E2C01_090921 [Portunus trituberculatus]|uniref:Uncharacterized protein n=1 Tax=Portunus trituberculatus TaxID=210409 RepID=A0A5B7JRM7_PORTR|nr:hypothetical protein [Portunus trituberculatus]
MPRTRNHDKFSNREPWQNLLTQMYFKYCKSWRTTVARRQLSDVRRKNNTDVRKKNVGGRRMNGENHKGERSSSSCWKAVATHLPTCCSVPHLHLALYLRRRSQLGWYTLQIQRQSSIPHPIFSLMLPPKL